MADVGEARAEAALAAAAREAGGWEAQTVESVSRNGLRAREGRQRAKHSGLEFLEGIGFKGVTLTQSVPRVWVDVRAVVSVIASGVETAAVALAVARLEKGQWAPLL